MTAPALAQFDVRGGDDWLIFASRRDAPDDDRVYFCVTECWPVWLDVEKRFGDGSLGGGPQTSLRNPKVLAMVAAEAEDRDFRLGYLCDECGEPYRFTGPEGIDQRCGCRQANE